MKARYRFDYRRGAWRRIYGHRVTRYWLTNCIECNKQTESLNIKFPRCRACAVTRMHAFSRHASKAHRKVYAAKLKGIIPWLDGSIKCTDCESPARIYDHRDYSKPLDVEPVCYSCNSLRGSAIDAPLQREKVPRARA